MIKEFAEGNFHFWVPHSSNYARRSCMVGWFLLQFVLWKHMHHAPHFDFACIGRKLVYVSYMPPNYEYTYAQLHAEYWLQLSFWERNGECANWIGLGASSQSPGILTKPSFKMQNPPELEAWSVVLLGRQNQCADHLARLGAEQSKELVVCELSPTSVRHFVFEDAMDAGFVRGPDSLCFVILFKQFKFP